MTGHRARLIRASDPVPSASNGPSLEMPHRVKYGMTRSELIARLATQFQQLTTKDAELSVKAILEGMSESLVRGDRIEIRGFGSFALNYRPARSGRNPSTGETVPVPAKRVPHFTPGKELRERVQAGHDGQERTR